MVASGFLHLQSTEPLFSQLVGLGGSPLIQPLPLQVAEIAFGIVTSKLSLENLSPADQVKNIVEISAQELSAKLAGVPFPLAAVVDGDIVKASPSVSNVFWPIQASHSLIGLFARTSDQTYVLDIWQC